MAIPKLAAREGLAAQVVETYKGLTYLDPQALNGTDSLRLVVCENDETGQVLLAAVFDNLGKGAAGAAVQNLDLMVAGT